MTLDRGGSRKLCNVVYLKLKLHTVLQIFVLICSKRVPVRDKTYKLVTNIPQLIEYGDFCKMYLGRITVFESVAFKWEQNV